MIRLEDLQPSAALRGILPDCLVTVVCMHWSGSQALQLTYNTPGGTLGSALPYREDEARLELVEAGRPWSFDGDGALFRLVAEAYQMPPVTVPGMGGQGRARRLIRRERPPA